MPKPRVALKPRDSNQNASGKPGAVHFALNADVGFRRVLFVIFAPVCAAVTKPATGAARFATAAE